MIDLKRYNVGEHLNEPLKVSDLRNAGATPKQIKGIMKARWKALQALGVFKKRKELRNLLPFRSTGNNCLQEFRSCRRSMSTPRNRGGPRRRAEGICCSS